MRRPVLSRGDTVGVLATGFAVPPASLRAGVARLRALGFRVRLAPGALERRGYLAGDDEARAADLAAMLADPAVDALWFARGGFGTARILDRVPWDLVARTRKPMVGYSDLTALFARVLRLPGQRCLHGPLVVELGDKAAYDRASLRACLEGRAIELEIGPRQVLAAGRARGRLAGGNLTVLVHLLGTPYAPDLGGRILFLEDVGEELYRVDRALTQLRASGALAGVRGILLGALRVPRTRRKFPPDGTLRALLADAFGGLGVPVVTGLPAGHVPGKWTLPLGGRAEIDTASGRLRLGP